MDVMPKRKWIPATTVAELLDVSRFQAERLGEQGHIGVLALPGMKPRYDLEDVLRLRDRCMKPARSESNGELMAV